MDKKYLQAHDILLGNLYTTLATSSTNLTPWATPLFFALDKNLNIYWISPKESVHSKNIKQNPNVAFTFFDSHTPKWEGIGVYIKATAKQITNPIKIAKSLKYIFNKLEEDIPPVEKFSKLYEYRVYIASPQEISITQDAKGHEEEIIDGRQMLKIEELQKIINLR